MFYIVYTTQLDFYYLYLYFLILNKIFIKIIINKKKHTFKTECFISLKYRF